MQGSDKRSGCGLVSLSMKGRLLAGPFAVSKDWLAQEGGGFPQPERFSFFFFKHHLTQIIIV